MQKLTLQPMSSDQMGPVEVVGVYRRECASCCRAPELRRSNSAVTPIVTARMPTKMPASIPAIAHPPMGWVAECAAAWETWAKFTPSQWQPLLRDDCAKPKRSPNECLFGAQLHVAAWNLSVATGVQKPDTIREGARLLFWEDGGSLVRWRRRSPINVRKP